MSAAASKGRRAADDRQPPRERSVFINCPFSREFQESMDAIVFTVVCCGFEPRMADDRDDTHRTRMQRIVEALRASRLSIHDLSLVHADARTGVAHLNMPLELGIAMAIDEGQRHVRPPHQWTALVRADSPYGLAVSDLAGYDLKRYTDLTTLIRQVMRWLKVRSRAELRIDYDPDKVQQALRLFKDELAVLRQAWGDPTWDDIVGKAREVARGNGVFPQPAGAAAARS